MDREVMQRLDAIDEKLQQHLLASKPILSFQEFCQFCGISESHGYKLTSGKQIPHFKPGGKMVYFKRVEVEEWLLSNPVKTNHQLETEAISQLMGHRRQF